MHHQTDHRSDQFISHLASHINLQPQSIYFLLEAIIITILLRSTQLRGNYLVLMVSVICCQCEIRINKAIEYQTAVKSEQGKKKASSHNTFSGHNKVEGSFSRKYIRYALGLWAHLLLNNNIALVPGCRWKTLPYFSRSRRMLWLKNTFKSLYYYSRTESRAMAFSLISLPKKERSH